MKIVKAKGSQKETYSEIDLFSDKQVPTSLKSEVQDKVGQFIVEQIRLSVGDLESPVQGESWKPTLKPKYKKYKTEFGATPEANMELTGAMLDALTFDSSKNGIKVGFLGTKEAWKADGHVKFSGKTNNTPKRRFLPGEGQNFKADIKDGVNEIINSIISENAVLDPEDVKDVENKTELYEVLNPLFEGLSRAEIKTAVLGTPKLLNLLARYDLLDLL